MTEDWTTARPGAPTVEWSCDFETGIPIVDEQHQGLFATINRLSVLCNGTTVPEEAMNEVLAALSEYVRVHFETEEGLMEAAGSPDLPEHRKAHHGFVNRLVTVLGCTPLSRSDGLALSIFLQRWLISHILTVDKRMATSLNGLDHDGQSRANVQDR